MKKLTASLGNFVASTSSIDDRRVAESEQQAGRPNLSHENSKVTRYLHRGKRLITTFSFNNWQTLVECEGIIQSASVMTGHDGQE